MQPLHYLIKTVIYTITNKEDIMRQYLKYMKGNWKYAILAPILIMIDSLGMVIQPYFLQKIIDIGIPNNDAGYIIQTGIIMVACALASLVRGIFSYVFFSKGSLWIFSKSKTRAFR